MSKLLKLTAILLVACILFTFMPTGTTSAQVVAVQSSLRTQGNVASSWQVAMEMQDNNTNLEIDDLRNRVVKFATLFAIKYGNGYEGGPEYIQQAPHYAYANSPQGGFSCLFPGCDEPSGYKYLVRQDKDTSLAILNDMVKGNLTHVHNDCWGTVIMCWRVCYPDIEPEGSPNRVNGGYLFQKYWVEVKTPEELYETAKPGDMLVYSNSSPGYNESTGAGNVPAHANMYIGEWTAPNGTHFEHAVMNCGSRNNYNDFVIKEWYKQTPTYMYVVPLDAILKDMAINAENADYSVTFADVVAASSEEG